MSHYEDENDAKIRAQPPGRGWSLPRMSPELETPRYFPPEHSLPPPSMSMPIWQRPSRPQKSLASDRLSLRLTNARDSSPPRPAAIDTQNQRARSRERTSRIRDHNAPRFQPRDWQLYSRTDPVIRRVLDQTDRYPWKLQKLIRPVTENERAMKYVKTTFVRLDKDSRFLSKSAADFIQGLQSVPDAGAKDDGYKSEDDDEQDGKDEKDGKDGKVEKDGNSESDDDDDYDDDDDDDDWPATLEESDASEREEDWGGVRINFAPPTAKADDDRANHANDFMTWRSFNHYALSRNPDIVNDRRKSLIAIAKTVEVGIPTPVGAVSVKGLFGMMAALLRRQDWRAYYQASSRAMLLPPEIFGGSLNEFQLEELERRVLGTSKYLAAGGPPMMTCLTYNDEDYGTMTLFDVEMRRDGKSAWPAAIRPHAVLPRVPKKLLKKIANDLPKAKKTELRVRSSKDNVILPDSRLANGVPKLRVDYNPDVERSELSKTLSEALVIPSSELARISSPNCIVATIPAMLAWLHARNAYLTNIKIESTGLEGPPPKMGATTPVPTKNLATLVHGPDANDHQGKNPTVVVIHPDKKGWVDAHVCWS